MNEKLLEELFSKPEVVNKKTANSLLIRKSGKITLDNVLMDDLFGKDVLSSRLNTCKFI